ncbi:hypothetical protein LUZ60_004206 [Juncus effusus]|nr:hypothetical protein LUZ60_004206 [Juncus effusus]
MRFTFKLLLLSTANPNLTLSFQSLCDQTFFSFSLQVVNPIQAQKPPNMKQKRVLTIGSLITKLKNGIELLSPFADHPVASILSLGAGVAGLYIAFSNGDSTITPWISQKEDDSSEIVCYVAGLHNLGNNCFLNVILQSLASCTSFVSYIQNVLESDKAEIEEMPLVFALNSLIQELSVIREERLALNPRKLMQSLSLYVSNFNLTRQQDAAEAFLHLLTSLKSEILLNHVPAGSFVSNITDFSSRVYNQNIIFGPKLDKWRNNIFGPFNGTIKSVLTCVSCSSVLSMDYEHFDCLAVSPVLDINGDIMDGCNIIDCLMHYTKVELLENYRCEKCWHIKALHYLSLKSDPNEEKINRLKSCVNYDNCTCETIFEREEIAWSAYSHAFKQLSVNHCPKILCVHVQRALMNINGEFIKHQGHISFPLILDLSPFIKSSSVPKTQLLSNIFQIRGENQNTENKNENNSENLVINKSTKYALCAVVEHYGRYGGGHYAAYRKAPPVHDVKESRNSKWFYVSDREVSEVSEGDVLSAEASMLFYEMI